ncbi:MAG TPA: polysaccharide deacetylase family protein [Ferruginibacter sp.]|nr:polysaccharide deacetylase family protein [Ferruginibacter sp.]
MKRIFFTLLKALSLNYYFKRKQANTLLILMFHRVNDTGSPFYCPMPVNVFRDLCAFIRERYEVIHISEIRSHFKRTTKPAAIISFDDGHYDIMENAFPVLSQLGLKFNINIDTEILDTRKPQDFVRVYDVLNHTSIESYLHSRLMQEPIVINRANTIATEKQFTKLLSGLTTQEKREVTDDLAVKAGMQEQYYARMLSRDDLRFLADKNVEFGAHSHTHSFLTNISKAQLIDELTRPKQILEDVTGKKIEVLAYPNGIYNAEVEKMAVSTGYKFLLQTGDEINHVVSNDNAYNSYKRVSQYHHTLAEALAHTYGVTDVLRNIIRKFKS